MKAMVRRQSFQRRVLVTTLAIIFAGIWFLSFIVTSSLQKDMERLLASQQYATVSLMAHQIERGFQARVQALEELAGRVGQLGIAHDLEAIQSMLEYRTSLHQLFNGGLLFVDEGFTVRADAPPQPGRRGLTYASSPYLPTVFQEKRTVISPPLIGGALQRPLVVIAAPVLVDGNVVGVISGAINLALPNFLDDIAAQAYGHSGGYLLVSPRDGVFVTGTQSDYVMARVPESGINPQFDRYMSGYEGSGISVSSKGVAQLSSAHSIATPDWFLMSILPVSEAFAPIALLKKRILLLALGLTLVSGLLMAWVLRRHFRPLHQAIHSIRSAAREPDLFPQLLEVRMNDEIGELLKSFNVLLETLGQQHRELCARDELLAKLSSQIPGVLYQFRLGPDGQFTAPYVSHGIRKIFELEFEDVKDDVQAVFQRIHPDELDDVLRSIDESARNLTPWRSEFRVLLPGRGESWREGYAMPEMQDDGSVLWHGFITDIDERKLIEGRLHLLNEHLSEQVELEVQERLQSEAKYQNLFNTIPDAIFIHPLDENNMPGVFEEVNESACRLLGLSREELLKLRPMDILPPEYHGQVAVRMEELLRKKHILLEQPLRTADGRVLTIERTSSLHAMNGRQILFSIVRDITEKKRLEREREMNQALLIQQSKLADLGHMIGAIAHQWKQPLNNIAIIAQSLPDMQETGELDRKTLVDYTDKLMNLIQFMNQTVDDFRSFYRPSREMAAFSPADDVRAVVQLLQDRLARHGIEVDMDTEGGPPAWGYSGEFRQAVLSVLNNAIDVLVERSVPQGHIAIELGVEGDFVMIAIEDNGGGISAELLPDKLFNAFTSTKGEEGTGIGLSLCRTIIEEKMGGRITARNTDGGARFTFWLPLHQEETREET